MIGHTNSDYNLIYIDMNDNSNNNDTREWCCPTLTWCQQWDHSVILQSLNLILTGTVSFYISSWFTFGPVIYYQVGLLLVRFNIIKLVYFWSGFILSSWFTFGPVFISLSWFTFGPVFISSSWFTFGPVLNHNFFSLDISGSYR